MANGSHNEKSDLIKHVAYQLKQLLVCSNRILASSLSKNYSVIDLDSSIFSISIQIVQ